MFTSIDKALIAIVGAILFLLSSFGIFTADPEMIENVNRFIVAITPALVWLIPNKGANHA